MFELECMTNTEAVVFTASEAMCPPPIECSPDRSLCSPSAPSCSPSACYPWSDLIHSVTAPDTFVLLDLSGAVMFYIEKMEE